jgi:hypothetical protein
LPRCPRAAWIDAAVRGVFEEGRPGQPQFEAITNVVMADARPAG